MTSGPRNMCLDWWKFCNRVSRANIVTSAPRNISRNCLKFSIAFLAPISWPAALATSPKFGRLQNNFISISRGDIVTLLALVTSPKLGRLQKHFNRISRSNIVTSDILNISKAWSTFKKMSIALLAPISWLATLATSPKFDRHQNNFNHISRGNSVTQPALATSPKLGRF